MNAWHGKGKKVAMPTWLTLDKYTCKMGIIIFILPKSQSIFNVVKYK